MTLVYFRLLFLKKNWSLLCLGFCGNEVYQNAMKFLKFNQTFIPDFVNNRCRPNFIH